MVFINKISSNSALDYAAEELKKYLLMMMPEGDNITVKYDPEATGGFRLGLMSDLGLDTSDVCDTELDDILYADCREREGIIAGSNPRSVLLTVYEYLHRQGCRFLMPGVDGEYVPIKNTEPVSFRHKPSMRYRGWCIEGSVSQDIMLESIDFTAKLGMNVVMIEFRVPVSYYRRYYRHTYNEKNRPPEDVSTTQILQWKKQCEAEIAKRGLQYHDVGHGWTADPFGIDSSLRNADGDNDAALSDYSRQFVAMRGGERKLNYNTPNYTQFCMSNPEAQGLFVNYVCDYAEKHCNIDYLHVWLGDEMNNHCECEGCKQKTPSDFYCILMNELDRELTARGLATRIVFIVYTDTTWAPERERIENPDRFLLMFAPISRSYTRSLDTTECAKTKPYKRNGNVLPATLAESFAYLDEWRRTYDGPSFAFEYHFWRHQYYDLSGIKLARLLNEDVKAYISAGIDGIIQDGSQRSFFPNGLAFYTYARTMFDSSISAEELLEDYYSTAYGETWRKFYDYLTELGDAVSYEYLQCERSDDPKISPLYSPTVAKRLEDVEEITERGLALIREHYDCPDVRIRTVSVRLLEMHAEYARLIAKALIPKALGKDKEYSRLIWEAASEIGKKETLFEKYYDHSLAFVAWIGTLQRITANSEDIIQADN